MYPILFVTKSTTTDIYPLSLHDALPIFPYGAGQHPYLRVGTGLIDDAVLRVPALLRLEVDDQARSEEHTSELQSQFHLVCRLLLEKKKSIRLTHKNRIDTSELLIVE